ncbi:hypothetical protein lerEdw1_000269 [Lerista edwardsae]|nr:hypothetical protein lerEdw1_000269 [Lerista edwardsae]
MGHFLSRKGSSLNADRSRRRRQHHHGGRPLRAKVPPPRNRSCFLRGPCMLCFLVHSASPPAAEEPQPPPPEGPSRRDSQLLRAALRAPEERAARRLLRLSPLAAAGATWEARGSRCRCLLLSGLFFVSSPVRGGFLGRALQGGEAPPEMVCKRKGVGLPACPPCKQPRCATGTGTGVGSPSPPPEAAGLPQGSLPEQHFCPLPCSSDCAREASPKDYSGEDGKGPAPPGSPSQQQQPELGGREKQEPREPDCEEPPREPWRLLPRAAAPFAGHQPAAPLYPSQGVLGHGEESLCWRHTGLVKS